MGLCSDTARTATESDANPDWEGTEGEDVLLLEYWLRH